jgi:hypothetical protein
MKGERKQTIDTKKDAKKDTRNTLGNISTYNLGNLHKMLTS